MIDLSDGLVSDLAHLCAASGVGASIEEALLPVSEDLKAYAQRERLDLYSLILHGGEDYGLLFSVQRDRTEEMERRFEERFGWRPWLVGETTEETGIFLIREDGSRQSLAPEGWDHFRTSGFFKTPFSRRPGPK
jgi:thiamine-monophosphate kinase